MKSMKMNHLFFLAFVFLFFSCQESSKTEHSDKTIKKRKTFSVTEKTKTERPAIKEENQLLKTTREDVPIEETLEYNVVEEYFNDNSYRVEISLITTTLTEFPTLIENGEPSGLTQTFAPDVKILNTTKKVVFEDNMITSYDEDGNVIFQESAGEFFESDAVLPGQENEMNKSISKLSKQELLNKYQSDNYQLTDIGNGLFSVEKYFEPLGMNTRSVIDFDNMLIKETELTRDGKMINKLSHEYIDIQTNKGVEKALMKVISKNCIEYEDGTVITISNERSLDHINITYFEE